MLLLPLWRLHQSCRIYERRHEDPGRWHEEACCLCAGKPVVSGRASKCTVASLAGLRCQVTNSRAKGDIELAFQQLLDIVKRQRGTG